MKMRIVLDVVQLAPKPALLVILVIISLLGPALLAGTQAVLSAVDQAQEFAQLVKTAIIWTVEPVKLAPISCVPFVLGREVANAHHAKQVPT